MVHPGCSDPSVYQRVNSHGVRESDHAHDAVASQLKKTLFATGETGVEERLDEDCLEDARSHKGNSKPT